MIIFYKIVKFIYKKPFYTKLMVITLDAKDRKILYELDINSRHSNSEIAKKVGLSKQVVGFRIKRLIQETERRRKIQELSNKKLDITPTNIRKPIRDSIQSGSI